MRNILIAVCCIGAIIGVVHSCIDPFDYNPEQTERLLVVDGQFTPQRSDHFVRINLTPLFGRSSGQPVKQAVVSLVDGKGEKVFYSETDEPGLYRLPEVLAKGEVGETYYLEIQRINGSVYRSTPQVMPDRVEMDSVYWELDGKIIRIYADTGLPEGGEPVFLKWEFEEDYSFPEIICDPFGSVSTCYIKKKEPVRFLALRTNNENDLQRFERVKVHSELGVAETPEEWRGRHYYSVYQQSINEDAYDYWRKTNDAANPSGTIFDVIPGTISGNIFNVDDPDETVVGFFELASVDTARTFILPGNLKENDFYFPPFCPDVFTYEQAAFYINQWGFNWECCNCLSLPGASTVKPEWF
jgi:hypothetical protein